MHRVTWSARELTLPWELRDVDVAVTPLVNLFPLAARAIRRPRRAPLRLGPRRCPRTRVRPAERLLHARAPRPPRSPARARPAAAPDRHARARRGTRAHGRAGCRRALLRAFGRAQRGVRARGGQGHRATTRRSPQRRRPAGFRTIVVAQPRNVADLSIPAGMEIRHDLSWAALRDLYAAAACVVLPLRDSDAAVGTDGSGLTALLEAWRRGKAVVASQRPALGGYLDEGARACSSRPRTRRHWRMALTSVSSPTRRAAEPRGAAARAAVEERLTTPRARRAPRAA